MEFLAKPEADIIELPRRAEEQATEGQREATNCKICGEIS